MKQRPGFGDQRRNFVFVDEAAEFDGRAGDRLEMLKIAAGTRDNKPLAKLSTGLDCDIEALVTDKSAEDSEIIFLLRRLDRLKELVADRRINNLAVAMINPVNSLPDSLADRNEMRYTFCAIDIPFSELGNLLEENRSGEGRHSRCIGVLQIPNITHRCIAI